MADQSVHPALAPSDEDVKIVIDGQEIVAKKGETVITVAARNGIQVPHYCWHPSLSVAGNCRLCLVEVHMPNPREEGKLSPLPKPVIGCQTPVSPGMHVFTKSDLAVDCQNGMMEFLLANHPLDCPICDRGGECMLQRYSMDYGQGHARMVDEKRRFKKPDFDDLIDIERNRCIMCTRCVRFSDEVAGEHVMGVFARGEMNYIGTFGLGPVSNILSGNVIDICPVGCLTSKPFRFKARVWELTQTQSTSVWDASGAKVTYWTRNRKLYRTTPPSRKYHDRYTVNEDTEEFIDNITRFGSDFGAHANRWDESRVRIGSGLLPAATSEALRQAAQGLLDVKNEHGAGAVAVVVSPRATMEEGYLAGKFARTVLGNDNVDWRMGFQGADAASAADMAFAHADGDLAGGFDAVVALNGDYLHTSPVFAMRVKEYARLNNKPVVLIGHHFDHYFADHAAVQLHCAPGATAGALKALAAFLSAEKPTDAHRHEVRVAFSIDDAALDTVRGVLKGEVKKALVLQDLETMNGAHLSAEVPAALLLKQALGEAWKYMPVLRDRNAFGLHAVGAQPGRLPGDASAVREAWGGVELPSQSGVAARDLVEKIESGAVKALVCIGADVLYSHPNRERLLAALDKLEFFVVTDLFGSPITEKAHVFLASASPLEKDGTYADVEGNLARLCATDAPAGGAKPDWELIAGLATLMGGAGFKFAGVSGVFGEMMALVAPKFAGSFRGLELAGPENDHSIDDPGGARRHTPEYNPGDYRVDGAHFRWSGDAVSADAVAACEAVKPAEGGFLAVWGGHVQGDDYHLNHSSIAHLLKAKPYAEINPVDAARLGVEDGHLGNLTLDGGAVEVVLRVRRGPAPGCLYVPSGLGGLNFAGKTAAFAVKLEALGVASEVGAPS